MLKPVWRMNTGDVVPSDLGDKILFTDLTVRSGIPKSWMEFFYWELSPYETDLRFYAYETNRTKAAKYERVECCECKGMGASFRTIRQELTECRNCDGMGYTMELKNDL